MTISTGAFDSFGIPQGTHGTLDDLSDVDAAEVQEGNSIIRRKGRWVPGGGNEVTIHASEPTDESTELWLDLDDDTGTGSPAYGVPTGGIISFGGGLAPSGWQLCDGSAAGTSALQAIVGPTVPDLRDRFIVGAGNSYLLKATGGAATITLTGPQSGVKGHTTNVEAQAHQHSTDPVNTSSGYISADHAHGGTANTAGPTHTHDDMVDEGITTGDSNDWMDTADDDTTGVILRSNIVRPGDTAIGHTHTLSTGGVNANHYHNTDIGATTSGSQLANHTHSVTAQDADQPFDNRPPYYALVYIIKQ